MPEVRITKDISGGVRVNGSQHAEIPSSAPKAFEPLTGHNRIRAHVIGSSTTPTTSRTPDLSTAQQFSWPARIASTSRSTPLRAASAAGHHPISSAGVARPSALAVPPEPPRAAPVHAGSALAVDHLHPRRRGWRGLIRSRGWRAGSRGQRAYREGRCGNCHGNFAHRNSLISIVRFRN
jgi:hypothetical protein